MYIEALKKSGFDRFMQDAPKAVWSIPYISVAFFPSLKQNFIAYCSCKVSSRPDCIFEIYQLWQSGFSRVYSNCCCSCSFESEIIKIVQSFHKMYSNNILNFQESMRILDTCTKKSGNLLKAPHMYLHTHAYIYIYIHTSMYTHIQLASIKIRMMLRKSLNVKSLFILKLHRTFY